MKKLVSQYMLLQNKCNAIINIYKMCHDNQENRASNYNFNYLYL